MPDRKERLVDAFGDQGKPSWGFAGTDAWKVDEVEKGTQIAQIEFRKAAEADLPNSRYFTTIEEIEELTGPNGKVDIAALSERLQVKVHGELYNPAVSIYEGRFQSVVATL